MCAKYLVRSGQYEEHNPDRSASPTSPDDGGLYEIVIKGHLADHWSEWLGDLTIRHDDQGNTRLSGTIPDQAALHGILAQIRNLGLVLLSVAFIETEVDDSPMIQRSEE